MVSTSPPATPKRARRPVSYVDATDLDSDASGGAVADEVEDDAAYEDVGDDGNELASSPSPLSSPVPTKKSKMSPTEPRGGSTTPRKLKTGGSSAGKWTPDEDWALFCLLFVKVDRPAWAEIAVHIGNGRDGQSCRNRFKLMSKKIEAAIKSISAGN
ncbi:hypothetical protein Q5752_002547 [Cryptotrichosporon argae]